MRSCRLTSFQPALTLVAASILVLSACAPASDSAELTGPDGADAPTQQILREAPNPDPMPVVFRPINLATYGKWHSSKIGGGGYLINGVFCPSRPEVVYWYSDVGGIFRSEDKGLTWRMIHGTVTPPLCSVRSLIVDPRDENRLIAAVGTQWEPVQGVYVSKDGGASWQRKLEALFYGNGPCRAMGVVLARHPHDPDRILVASDWDGVFLSADNGESWEYKGLEGLRIADLKYDVADPDRVWLCANGGRMWRTHGDGSTEARELGGGFFASSDGGVSWTRISDASPDEVRQVPSRPEWLYGIHEGGFVRVSRDKGLSWEDASEGLETTGDSSQRGNASGYKYRALGAGPDFALAGSGDGTFYLRAPGAEEWLRLSDPGVHQGDQWYGRRGTGGWDHFGRATASILVDPWDPDHWYFSDWYAVYQSLDAGQNWTLTIDGIEMTVIHVLQQDPKDPTIVHMGMADNGYFFSPNGGESFLWPENHPPNNVKCIALSPQNPDLLYCTGTRGGEWKADQFFVSTDRGKTWTRPAGEGLPEMADRHVNSIAVHPAAPQIVYMTVSGAVGPGDGGVYATRDRGESWEWDGEGLPAGVRLFKEQIWSSGRELAVSPDGSMLVSSQTTGEIFRRTGDGIPWMKVDVTGSPFDMRADPFSPGRFYVSARQAGVLRTSDAGVTWETVQPLPSVYLAVDEAKPGRLACSLADYRGFLLSEDGGETWKELDENHPHEKTTPMAFCGDRLVTGSGGNGCFWLPLTAAAAKLLTE